MVYFIKSWLSAEYKGQGFWGERAGCAVRIDPTEEVTFFLSFPLFFLIALLRYNLCTMKFTHFKCTTQWFLSIFTDLCNYHLYQVLGHFHDPKEIPCQSLLPSQSQAATNPLSVSMGLPFLDIFYKQDHTTCGLLCLLSHSVMFSRFICVVHVSVVYFFLLLSSIHCVDRPHSVYPFIPRTFGLFPVGGCYE